MVPLDPAACLVDDLRNFLSDVGDHDGRPDDPSRPLIATEEAEEDLEWISNKDAFPAVETFILSEQAIAKHQSPVSVLENSTNSSSASLMSSCGGLKPPHRARTKGRRRRSEIPAQQLFWNQPIESKPSRSHSASASASKLDIGRKCLHCGTDQTPQWRAGPHGPKTLCNACGVRYKSGRLCPEYRPASSPTFSSEVHSNSHRKVLEMRKQKYGMGMVVKPEDKESHVFQNPMWSDWDRPEADLTTQESLTLNEQIQGSRVSGRQPTH